MKAAIRLAVTCALAWALAPAARAEVGITGSATVPRQDGKVDYDIRVGKTGKNKFNVKVRLKPKKEPTSSFTGGRFYICMMFQLTKKKECPERGRTKTRKGERRFTLTTIPCNIANPGPEGDDKKKNPVLKTTCWCCKEEKEPNTSERNSYHLGCFEIADINTHDPDKPWIDKDVSFDFDPPDPKPPNWDADCNDLSEDDIESIYWDTFVEDYPVNKDKLPRHWVNAPDCNSDRDLPKNASGDPAPDDIAKPEQTCPGIGEGGAVGKGGQDTSMGPPGGPLGLPSGGQFGGVFLPGIDGVNIWAGAFSSVRLSPEELICTTSRGQKVRKLDGTPLYTPVPNPPPRPRRVSMLTPQPESEKRCAACDGKTQFCWYGAAPLDNFWTMRWAGEYAARLGGYFYGPVGAKVTIIIPGQVAHDYIVDATGKVQVDDAYVIGRDSQHWENDMQVFVSAAPAPGMGSALATMRLEAEVVAGPGNPLAQEGQLLHLVNFSPPQIEYVDDDKPSRRWSFSLTFGGDFEIYQEPNQGMFGVQLGYDVWKRLWLVFAPEVKLNSNLTTIMLPLGVQYDFALPVPGLYLYPRGELGYAVSVVSFSSGGESFRSTASFGVFTAVGGIKYELNDRWMFGLEPVGLSIFFSNTASVVYRLAALLGVKF